MRRLIRATSALVVLLAFASCREASAPSTPRTLEAGEAAVDRALEQLNWALVDCYKAGCRALIVGVQVDTAQPPHLWRLRGR